MSGPWATVLSAACAVASCAPAPAAPPQKGPVTPSALAAVLTTAACPALSERLFSFAAEGDVLDTYVWVKRCSARAEESDIVLSTDAYAWVAADRDFGFVGIRQFLHATVRADARLEARAAYVDHSLTVTLTPRSAPRVAVEPVGALDVMPLNWAALLAIDLAPAAGASPEALAKEKLREEFERTLTSSLRAPVGVVYDARSGTTSLGAPSAPRRKPRVRIAPRGTALLGPFPPSGPGSFASIRLDSEGAIYARAVCRSHAGELIDADRRGDPVRTDDWEVVHGSSRLTFRSMPCTWMLALRSTDGVVIAELGELHTQPATTPLEAPDRWVAVDDAKATGGELDPEVWIAIESDRWQTTVLPGKGLELPAVSVLAPDESLWVRARRRANGAVIAAAVLPLEPTTAVELTTSDGRPVTTLNVHLRVRSRYGDR